MERGRGRTAERGWRQRPGLVFRQGACLLAGSSLEAPEGLWGLFRLRWACQNVCDRLEGTRLCEELGLGSDTFLKSMILKSVKTDGRALLVVAGADARFRARVRLLATSQQ